MAVTLVLLRHGKSDWSVDAPDEERPLTRRGRRQAAESGRWIGEHVDVDLAVVSMARRAQQTWELADAELPDHPVRHDSETLYTFDASGVLDVVRGLGPEVRTAVVVGHNPAFEDAVHLLTGRSVPMPTACVAVVRLRSWAEAGRSSGELTAHGRPPGSPAVGS